MHEVYWGVFTSIPMRDRGEPERAEGGSNRAVGSTEAADTDPKGSPEVGGPQKSSKFRQGGWPFTSSITQSLDAS